MLDDDDFKREEDNSFFRIVIFDLKPRFKAHSKAYEQRAPG